MRSWMKYSIYITSLILVALILLPSLAVGKPPEDKDKDKDNGKPPKTKDEVKFVTITSSSGSHGNVSPSGSVKVKIGDDQRFKIRANGGYSIEEVKVDGSLDPDFENKKKENEHIREWEHLFENVQESHTISATFERDVFTIKALARGPGRISPPGAVKVSYGDNQEFTIRATQGFCIDDVQISPSDDKNTLDMDEAKGESIYTFSFNGVTLDYTIIVTFARLKEPEPDPKTDPETLTIESEVEDGGRIDPSGEVEVEYGSDQTFTIIPEPCYHIAVVEVDSVPVDVGIDEDTGEGTYTFSNVTSDHTINATFEKITYTITATADEGGSIVPSGEVQVECGGNQLFRIKFDKGYTRGSVLVDGSPVKTKGNKYEFTDVRSDHKIEVTFVNEPDEDDLKGDVNNDGKVNSGDAIFILLIVTGQVEPTEQQKLAADVNGDGVIDVNDALFVLNIVAGLAAPDANVDNALLQNFPNPFNPETWIPFSLSKGSEVTIEIYDATGHLLRRLPLGHKPAGFYTSREKAAYWDGCNEDGERVASGVYFYAIRAAKFADMKKMIIAQ